MDHKEKGEMSQSFEEDSILGQLYVKDQLTGVGIRKNDSATKLSALLGQPKRPDAKFDQQTGKYYKSFAVPMSRFVDVDVASLLNEFSKPGLSYNHSSHTGAVVSLTPGGHEGHVHVAVVGESHVEAHALYSAARTTMEVFLQSKDQLEGSADSTAGISLLSETPGSQQKIDALGFENAAGISLFSNAGRVQDCMTADTCAGFSLFSYADDSSAEQNSTHADDLEQLPVCDVTTAGVTLFPDQTSGSESKITSLRAEHCAGISMYSRAKKQSECMTADFVGGMTLLSYTDDDFSDVDTAPGSEEGEDEEVLNNSDVLDLWSVMTNCAGLTLFGHKRAEEPVFFHETV